MAVEARREVGEEGVGFPQDAGVGRESPGHCNEDHHLPDGDDGVDEVPGAVKHPVPGSNLSCWLR